MHFKAWTANVYLATVNKTTSLEKKRSVAVATKTALQHWPTSHTPIWTSTARSENSAINSHQVYLYLIKKKIPLELFKLVFGKT